MEGKGLYRYPGTRPFEDTNSDRRLFFGRERETGELLQKIIAGKLVVLHAESGLGKTSLLNAGVSALLRERGFLPIKVRFNLAEINPIQTVFNAITETAAQQHLDLEPGETETLWHYFKTAAFWSPDDTLQTPVLIFDQFEEFFVFHEPEAMQEFIRQLADLVHNTLPSALRQAIRTGQSYRYGENPPRVKIVISIRSDFVGQLDELSSAVPEILDNRFRLLALTRIQAREAITGPAQIEDEHISTPCFRYSEEAVNTMLDYLSRRRERGGVVSKDEVESFQLQQLCRHIETNMWEKETLKTKENTEEFDFKEKGDFFRFTSLGSHSEAGILEKTSKADGQEEWEVKKEDLGGEAGLHKVFQYFYENQLAGLKPGLEKRLVRRLCEKGLITASNRRLSLEEEVIETQYKVSPALLAQMIDNRLLRAEKRVGSVYYELSHDSLITPIRLSQKKRRATLEKYVMLLLAPVFITVMIFSIIGIVLQVKIDHYLRLGNDYYKSKKYDAAIDSYRKALELKPDYAVGYYNIGNAYEKKGEYEYALKSYKKALILKPDFAEVYINMGNAQFGKGDYDAAIASYLKVLELKSDSVEAYNVIGNAQSKKGDNNAAIESFQKALELKSTDLPAKENLAELYLITDRFDKAVSMAKEVLKEKDVPLDDILVIKSIIIPSLFFQDNQSQALMELQKLITVYRGLTIDYKRDWDYSTTKKFITRTQRLSEPTRALLLKLIDLMEAPKKEAEPILVELEKMVAVFKR
jgi:tetratricopeptide (TPR) repeat protein